MGTNNIPLSTTTRPSSLFVQKNSTKKSSSRQPQVAPVEKIKQKRNRHQRTRSHGVLAHVIHSPRDSPGYERRVSKSLSHFNFI